MKRISRLTTVFIVLIVVYILVSLIRKKMIVSYVLIHLDLFVSKLVML